MKIVKSIIIATLFSITSVSHAGNDGVSVGDVVEIVKNLTKPSETSVQTQISVSYAEDLEATNETYCDASSNSSCQSSANLSTNQNVFTGAGSNTSVNTQIAVGVVSGKAKITNRGSGSASGNSSNQSSAGGAANQNSRM